MKKIIIIYTDGSTLKNGSKNAVGGFGVVVCEGNLQQKPEEYKLIAAYAERAEGTTNNRMEMSAILWALENYGSPSNSFPYPLVYSDSMYCVNSFTKWIKGWKRNGWTRAGGAPLENLDLIQKYDILTSFNNKHIELYYVKGHNGNIWNELADKLATGQIKPEEIIQGD